MEAIKTEKLTKYYGKSRGIIDLNLTVDEGEFFGFIGPNGAGKSTTIRTLLGLIKKSSGSGRILGMDIEKEKEKILSCVGYLPSEAMFYRGMRVRDILKLSADLRKTDCRGKLYGCVRDWNWIHQKRWRNFPLETGKKWESSAHFSMNRSY